MKKVSRLLASFAAIAMLSACSSEEPMDGGKQPVGPNGPVGDTAYMKISIGDVNDVYGAPASKSSDLGNYEDGIENEHAVTSAQFFFFDGTGTFVLKGKMVNPNFKEDDPIDENIEYMGSDNILVLEGLTEKGWPEYMITVLNDPNFAPESTIEATAKRLASYGASGNMVMSTSSYFSTTGNGEKNHDNKYPYATKLESTDFYTTPDAATTDGQAVKIYVERLAAKVKLSLAETLAAKAVKGTDKDGVEHTLYKLTQTVAGKPNDQENPDQTATTDLYIEVLGWNLSGTANKAYMSKQLSSGWQTAAPFGTATDWAKPDYFRSFWAESAVYGQNPVANVTGSTAADALGLVYTKWGTDNKTLGGYDYCNENTNDAKSLFATNNTGTDKSVITSQTTHVVLKTNICDANGNKLDMVNYHGVLYLEDSYIQYILDKIEGGNKDNLNFYTKLNAGGDGYEQVTPAFFKLEAQGTKTGQVHVVVADETAEVYKKVIVPATETEAEHVKFEPANISDLKTKLADNQPAADAEYVATAYKGGMNVYYIPVEHKGTAANAGKEGYYGVVRNHYYNLTINSFSKVGFGVFNPDEVLIPQGPQDPLYYLGVDINILSWKIVNQNVDL